MIYRKYFKKYYCVKILLTIAFLTTNVFAQSDMVCRSETLNVSTLAPQPVCDPTFDETILDRAMAEAV